MGKINYKNKKKEGKSEIPESPPQNRRCASCGEQKEIRLKTARQKPISRDIIPNVTSLLIIGTLTPTQEILLNN